MNRLITCCLLLGLQLCLYAQWREPRLSTVGPEEGLVMRVNSMVQDNSGYLYFAGSQGLIRYDGSNLLPFVNILGDSTSISSGEVYNVITDQEGYLWLTIRFSGLNRFDPKTNTFKRYIRPLISARVENGCNGLLEDAQGDIWAGGHRLQLYRVNPKNDTLETFVPQELDLASMTGRLAIVAIIQDKANEDILWLSVTDYTNPDPRSKPQGYGLISFNKRTKKFKPHPNIGRIAYQDDNHKIWSTHLMNGYFATDPQSYDTEMYSFETSDHPAQYMSRDLLDFGPNKWILTAQEILNVPDNGEMSNVYRNNSEEPIFIKFYPDSNGTIWITTEQGVRALDKKANQIQFFSLSEFGDGLRIYPGRLGYDKNQNAIYLSSYNEISKKRLYKIPLDQSQPAEFIETEHAISGISSDHKGKMWFSGGGQMYELYENKLRETKNTGLRATRIPGLWNMRSNDAGYLGMLGGNQFLWFHSDSSTIHSVHMRNLPHPEDGRKFRSDFLGFNLDVSDNAILFSSQIFQINLRTKQKQELKYDDSFNPNGDEIFDVRVDKNNYYWISGPLFTGKFGLENDTLTLIKAYTVQDGLAEAQVTEMHIDFKNRVWCFTGSGVNCIDQQTNEIRYFGVKEGLPHTFTDPRQVITLPDHRIATVNKNGLIVFHPDSLWNVHTSQNVPIAINNIRLNGVDVETQVTPNYMEKYMVPSGKNIIDIEFQGLAYPSANQLVYSYRLLGLQDNWIDIGKNNSVTLSGLSSGQYTFQVKAGRTSSNAPVKELAIQIPRPFYENGWFGFLSLGLIGTLIYLIYQYRVRKVKMEEEEKTRVNKKIAELELKALRSQMNPHFMFNSLNSIKNYILRSEPTQAAEYLSNFAHLIRMILQNSREKTISLHDELESLILYIELEQLRFDDEFHFHCEIGPEVQMENTFIPPMILQPYIENAIWHGLMHKKSKGTLSLNFSKSAGYVCCIIEDDGVGREKALELKNKSIRKYKSMGMGITQDRIELVNKMDSLGISVEIIDLNEINENATGTRVIVKIPFPTNGKSNKNDKGDFN